MSDKLTSALEELVEDWQKKDELDRINQDLTSMRTLFVIFAASVVVWSAAITLTVHLLKG